MGKVRMKGNETGGRFMTRRWKLKDLGGLKYATEYGKKGWDGRKQGRRGIEEGWEGGIVIR